MDYHIFYSQSWINQLIAEAVIKIKDVPHDRVIFLRNRGFDFTIGQFEESRSFTAKKIVLSKLKHLFTLRKQQQQLDSWIKSVVGTSGFQLYVPHLYPLGLRYLSLHPNCKAIHFIEEGLLSYHSKEKAAAVLPVKVPFGSLLRLVNPKLYAASKVSLFPTNFGHAYSISDNAFPSLEKSRKENLKNIVQDITAGIRINDKIQAVLVLAAFVNGSYKWPLNKYLEGLQKVVDYIVQRGFTEVHYKYHPSDDKTVRSAVKLFFGKQGIKFVLLDDSVSLEVLMFRQKPHMFMFNCSLALYALQANTPFTIVNRLIDPSCNILELAGVNFSNYYA